MGQMPLWEMILAGVLALLMILWFTPGIKRMLEDSRNAQEKDWRGFLIPIALVALFVILLLATV